MRSYRIGGYHGPVTILTRNNIEVAHGACRSTTERDYDGGAEFWNGEIRHLTPPNVLEAGPYRLRFPDGELGDVAVRPPAPGGAYIYFAGVGHHPLSARAS